MVLAALFLSPLLIMNSCATRGDVNLIIADLDKLKKDNEESRKREAVRDSLQQEQLKLMRALSADVNYNLEQLTERMQIIEGKLEDLTMRQSEGTLPNSQYNVQSAKTNSSADSGQLKVEISSKKVYDTAYMDFIKGNYKIAISGFKSYLKNNPKTTLSDNAQFLIAESYFNLKSYNSATKAYTTLLKKFSKSEKVPAAMVRLVEISLKRKDLTTANRYYQKLEKSFPNEDETARAKDLITNYRKKRK